VYLVANLGEEVRGFSLSLKDDPLVLNNQPMMVSHSLVNVSYKPLKVSGGSQLKHANGALDAWLDLSQGVSAELTIRTVFKMALVVDSGILDIGYSRARKFNRPCCLLTLARRRSAAFS
jgi:hypothetical protein